jgi:hypothetical protein
MRAIRTKYFGATNFRPARIVASDGTRNKIVRFKAGESEHALAAHALQVKLRLAGRLIGGELRKGEMVWVVLMTRQCSERNYHE